MKSQILQRAYEIQSVKEVPTRAGSGAAKTGASGSVPFRRLGKSVPFNSTVERDFLLNCRLDIKIVDIVFQPFSFEFFSPKSDKKRVYTPDYLVERDLAAPLGAITIGKNMERVLVEAKRSKDLVYISEDDIERMASAVVWATSKKTWDFDFFTDEIMSGDRGEAIRFFAGFAERGHNQTTHALINLLLTINPLTFEQAIERLCQGGYDDSEAVSSVMTSIANGWVRLENFCVPTGRVLLFLGEHFESFKTNT